MKSYALEYLIMSMSLIIPEIGVCHCCLHKSNQPLLLPSVSLEITSIVRVLARLVVTLGLVISLCHSMMLFQFLP